MLGDRRQFVDDDPFDFCRAVQDILQPGDVRFQVRRFLCTPEDVFAVQVAQLDLSHILCLHLVDAEADHQVGHHLGFLFGLAHNAHSLVDIQQNGLQALEQMQALFLALQIVIRTAAHALGAERGHSPNISRTPITRGMPEMRILKLHGKLSSSGVMRNSFCITLSASCPRLRSMVSLRPLRSVSSRMSLISFTRPDFTSSAILSIMASIVVVGGIWVTSIILPSFWYSYRARTRTPPRPVS